MVRTTVSHRERYLPAGVQRQRSQAGINKGVERSRHVHLTAEAYDGTIPGLEFRRLSAREIALQRRRRIR